ncbi:MAG TPA: orotidine-5'-phosphate decarboxylase [Pyrinomonadaceae bacterium]
MADSAKNRLIVALDVETAREAFNLFCALRDVAGMFKIGSQLFTAEGPGIVRDIVHGGGRVFLDLKFHDIPNTVAAAGAEAARLGVSIFNVHASGGGEMMRRTVDAVNEVTAREGVMRPHIIGVTVLTSADDSTLVATGCSSKTEEQVERLARLSEASGLDGVVASPHEVKLVREAVSQSSFIIVTPGVRPAGVVHDDQRRVMTPAEAIRAGADYLVIGRAILKATDPARTASEIIEEMRQAES